jgi:hypothetical protein
VGGDGPAGSAESTGVGGSKGEGARLRVALGGDTLNRRIGGVGSVDVDGVGTIAASVDGCCSSAVASSFPPPLQGSCAGGAIRSRHMSGRVAGAISSMEAAIVTSVAATSW